MFVEASAIGSDGEVGDTEFTPTKLNKTIVEYSEAEAKHIRQQLERTPIDKRVHLVHSVIANNQKELNEQIARARSLIQLSGAALASVDQRKDLEFVGNHIDIHFRGVRAPSDLYGETEPQQEDAPAQ